ncbi:Maf family nucleotide pyrophosphatase [Aestuariivirga sp.]|jgi:septum formation protein|uniref:Maf family nucleotide pyrophosphatase n=1 Tax=Aestuariivirga sp. TaxID=2650926 RepID=UPI003784EE93
MIVLASTSLTRQSMLRNASVEFEVEAPQLDERELVRQHPEWSFEDTALQLAAAKAIEVSSRRPKAIVVGADQVLALDDRVYSKPRNRVQCHDQLLDLRGKTHLLLSGVAVAQNEQVLWMHQDTARLTMRHFTDEFIDSYLDVIGDDCMSSVGGYKIEGPGIQLFSSVEGNHFTILGLPLLPLLQKLRDLGEARS